MGTKAISLRKKAMLWAGAVTSVLVVAGLVGFARAPQQPLHTAHADHMAGLFSVGLRVLGCYRFVRKFVDLDRPPGFEQQVDEVLAGRMACQSLRLPDVQPLPNE